MFSNKRNINQLVALVLQHGVSHVVVCPGSRNAAIVNDFAEAGLSCHPVTDERSAGFFALGLSLALAQPVVVCVTSGSAVLNLAPAVSEAFYQRVPLIVVSGDRPERWIGQMDGQTLPQPGAFGSLVAKCVSLPEPEWDDSVGMNAELAWHVNRMVNEALSECRRLSLPVHINVPLTEPLFDFSRPELPVERVFSSIELHSSVGSSLPDCLMAEWGAAPRRLVVVGQLHPSEAAVLEPLLARLQAVVVAEHLANLHGVAVANADEVLVDAAVCGTLVPDLVVTIGGHIVSKPLKKFLRQHRPLHWHVSPFADSPDLFMSLSRVVCASPAQFLSALANSSCSDVADGFVQRWHEASVSHRVEVSSPDLDVLRAVVGSMPADWAVHVANSSMVRNLQKLPLGSNPVFCNRGVNGIEGSVSEAVGFWAANGNPTLLLVGDLSFFYDQNALWNSAVHNASADSHPLRIVILNNGCGQIFHSLPGLSASSVCDSFVAARHQTSARGIALQNGCRYLEVEGIPSEAVLQQFLNPAAGGVAILEVFV